MANLQVLHIDLDTGKIIAKAGVGIGVGGGGPFITEAAADAKYVNVTGDTMTGQLNLVGLPVNNSHAANKQYVDNSISMVNTTIAGLSSTYVLKSGDTMTGQLNLAGLPVNNSHAANKQYVDLTIAQNAVAKTGDTMTGLLTLSGNPTAPLHAATKQYVDGILSSGGSNLDTKESVRLATLTNISLTGLQNIDGVTTVAGDRILVKNQTNPAQNGIYVASSGAWVRSTDTDNIGNPNEVTSGMYTFVEQGSQAQTGWILSTPNPIILNTTPLQFVKFAMVGTDFVAKAGDTMTGPLILSQDPILPLGAVTKQYVDLGIGNIGVKHNQLVAQNVWTIPHNRGTSSVLIQTFNNTNEMVIPASITIVDPNNVLIDFGEPVAGSALLVFFD